MSCRASKIEDVEIIHHSISSTIEIITSFEEETSQGVFEKEYNQYWFDYTQYKNLVKAIEASKKGTLRFLFES